VCFSDMNGRPLAHEGAHYNGLQPEGKTLI
jgi:hypothetical protein